MVRLIHKVIHKERRNKKKSVPATINCFVDLLALINLFLNRIIYLFILVPGAGLEPARSFLRGILSPLCLPIPPPGQYFNYNLAGGWGRNRTGVQGFAILCITTLPPSHAACILFLLTF